MYRCARRDALRLAGLNLLAGSLASLAPALPAFAQQAVARTFPANALRGVITLQGPSAALLNGKPASLAPGLRIRGTDNLLVLSGAAVSGQKFTAHYTLDFLGQLQDVWILRPDEIARYWPRSAEEAAARVFNPAEQTWTQP